MKLSVGSHEIELKDYLTGGQDLELRKMQLKASRMTGFNMQTQEPTIESDLSIEIDIQEKALQMLIVTFDGVAEKAYEKVLELPREEFEKVTEAIDDLRGKKKSEEMK